MNREVIFRPFQPSPHPAVVGLRCRLLRHPVFAWLGWRPVFAQHTAAEHEAMKRWARGCATVVEIGVAEGASALAFRQAMSPQGTLYLVDPFHLGRTGIRATKRAARAAVARSKNGRVQWIEQFSADAVRQWSQPVDVLFLDGDHSPEAVRRDWDNWHRFVVPGGVAMFHDARVFPDGWPDESDGPVQVVNDLFRAGRNAGWRVVDEVDSLVVVRREA